jgi:hypothetical protein
MRYRKLGSAKIIFPENNNFWYLYESDPLSPPEGEAPQGEHPLDPLFLGNFINLPAPPCLEEALRRGTLTRL